MCQEVKDMKCGLKSAIHILWSYYVQRMGVKIKLTDLNGLSVFEPPVGYEPTT